MFIVKIFCYSRYDYSGTFSFVSRTFANKADAMEWAGKKVMPMLLTHQVEMNSVHYYNHHLDVEVFEQGNDKPIHSAYFTISI